jgi:outer membrane lipoprotein SlyB
MSIAQKGIVTLLLLALLVPAGCTQYQTQGGLVGGGLGGIAGALLDSGNPWRGGIIGAGLGALAGATIADISARGSHEAAVSNQPVEYRTDDGRGYYRADPIPQSNGSTDCKKVRERIYENGRLVKDRVREVCEGRKHENRY